MLDIHEKQHTATHCNTLQHTATHCDNHQKKCGKMENKGKYKKIEESREIARSREHYSGCARETTHCNTLQQP